MTMNLRRGLFRLWLVLSAFFIVVVFALLGPDVKREFDASEITWDLPVNCTKARGFVGRDYHHTDRNGGTEFSLTVDDLPSPNAGTTESARSLLDNYSSAAHICWYQPATFRRLYPEYKDMPDSELGAKLNSAAALPSEPMAAPWAAMLRMLSISLGLPIAALLLGSALFWAFSGFKR